MSEELKPGDVVRLKSGGPKMTVVNFGSYGMSEEKSYLCKWFDDKNKPMELTFSPAELERVNAKSAGVF